MPISHCPAIRTTQDDPYRTREQDAAGQDLLKVPSHILELIGDLVASGNTPLEAAANSVALSRVCVLTHLTSHEWGVAQKIQQQVEDDSLLKMWASLSSQLNFDENPPPHTLAEIKAWLEDAANADQLNAIRELNLSYHELKTIPPQITKCSQLQRLYLDHNKISNISPLGTLSQLRRLSLDHNKISDIAPLGTLSELEWLCLDHNRIADISALGNLDQLVELYLDRNQIADISTLGNLAQLGELHLGRNQIADISALAALNRLTWLSLPNNLITNILPLVNLSELRGLFHDGNPLLFIDEKKPAKNTTSADELKSLINRNTEFSNYKCESTLSHFVQFIAQGNSEFERVQEKFAELPAEDKNLIYEMVYEESESESEDPQWGERHAFDDRAVFYHALRSALSTKFDRLSLEEKTRVYEHVDELAGRPETDDPKWGEHHAFDNVLRLVDAMNRI
ncbi:MAG: leucine-rich repeat domain-containing protein [Verrucomicrobia bacterium]|nr:leucine-rich repeat domain-containing protein [Verrucomicrobiota bacterium]